MDRKISRNENTSTQTKKSWPLVKTKTQALHKPLEGDSNIFELL